MTTIYGPEDSWPVHKKAHWRPPLEQARAAGWTLTYLDAPHTFGYVACPTGQHTFKVDGTASGAPFFATEASKTIQRKCRHGTSNGVGKVRERVARGTQLLDRVDEILNLAEAQLAHAETYQGAWATVEHLDALADQLLLQLATASGTLLHVLRDSTEPGEVDLASDLDGLTGLTAQLSRVKADLDAVLASADALGQKPDTIQIGEALTEASGTVADAENVAIALVRRPALAESLHERASKARAHIAALETRLIAVQEHSASADS